MISRSDRDPGAEGNNARPPLDRHADPESCGLVLIDGTSYYAVPDVDRMPPFLMSIVSDGDRWMFLSSSGGLTAGRRDASRALFPYETDDRLHLLAGLSGPVTAVRVQNGSSDGVWHPMLDKPRASSRRILYKSVIGDSVILDEVDTAIGLRFRYRWMSSDQYGFIRTSTLLNEGDRPVVVDLIDGLRNILPHGLDPAMYLPRGNLTNAYKRGELIDPSTRLAVYSLESLVTDEAEPAQALRATVAWSTGLNHRLCLLDPWIRRR